MLRSATLAAFTALIAFGTMPGTHAVPLPEQADPPIPTAEPLAIVVDPAAKSLDFNVVDDVAATHGVRLTDLVPASFGPPEAPAMVRSTPASSAKPLPRRDDRSYLPPHMRDTAAIEPSALSDATPAKAEPARAAGQSKRGVRRSGRTGIKRRHARATRRSTRWARRSWAPDHWLN